MDRNDLIKKCKYYKGEESQDTSKFWDWERAWVQANLNEQIIDLQNWYNAVDDHNLLDWANKEYPETPTTLIGCILNRFLHNITYQGDVTIQEFKEFYQEKYEAAI